jgi:hypothetical protein
MKSVGQKIMQVEGLLGTRAVNDWETGFIESIVASTRAGKETKHLTADQVQKIEQIYNRHFA